MYMLVEAVIPFQADGMAADLHQLKEEQEAVEQLTFHCMEKKEALNGIIEITCTAGFLLLVLEVARLIPYTLIGTVAVEVEKTVKIIVIIHAKEGSKQMVMPLESGNRQQEITILVEVEVGMVVMNIMMVDGAVEEEVGQDMYITHQLPHTIQVAAN